MFVALWYYTNIDSLFVKYKNGSSTSIFLFIFTIIYGIRMMALIYPIDGDVNKESNLLNVSVLIEC